MNEENWLKYGAIALAAIGFLVIIGIAVVADESVEGETWVADELQTASGNSQPLAGTFLSVVFDDGSLSGTSGCNTYFTSYAIDGDSIEIGVIGSTRAFCSDPTGVMDQESAYLGLLERADHYERDGDRLVLLEGDNVLVIYFAAKAELFDS
jgi:heat shock protein HslJ